MKNLKKVLALSLSLSLALPLAACGDQGETEKGGGSTGSYPSSTITVVCPWDAGGTSDGLCRIVSEIGARDEYFGVILVVQNSGGAGGADSTGTFASEEERKRALRDELRALLLAAVILVYAALFQILGYFISTLLAATVILLIFRVKKIWAYPVVYAAAVAIWAGFTFLLSVRLP